jgi:hypothetical protein
MYKKIFLGLCAVGVIAVGLVACGGGSGAGSNSGTATTINGIAVPPAPDAAANNATLAGVDSNNNGLRDDAEIMIVSLTKKDAYESYVLQIAKLMQRLATESISSQTEYNTIQTQIYCLNAKRTQQEKEILSIQDIESSIVNSRERSAKLAENDGKYANGWTSAGGATCN